MDGFPWSRRQEVVLRDLDGFGHVNNAVFLSYAENGRVSYLKDVVGAAALEEIRNIMASASIEFRAEVSYGDQLEVGVRVDRIGTKSFQMTYRMVRQDGVLAAEVSSTQVMFDFETGEAIEVPEDWRAAIESHEGRAGKGISGTPDS
jgi:acyl-CoA thioester hydrolase